MKRIAFITSNDYVPWGGSEELWLQCALEASARSLEVAICVQWSPLPARLKAVEENNKDITWFIKKTRNSFFIRLYNKLVPSKYKIDKQLYKQQIVKWQPDAVVISQGNNADGLAIVKFCLQNGIKYYTISQAVYEGIWPDTKKADLMREAFTNAQANYFVSKANHNVTELQIGEHVKSARVVRNPFNVPYNSNIPYPDTKTYKLACVARYEFYAKGQDVLLEVLSQEKWKNRNIEVSFYGSGPNEEGIRRLIKHFGLTNVHVAGHKLTTDIWKENHALILPSRFEGLPLALVEAMLSGRFGILSDVSGNAEAFVDNESGFLAAAPKKEYVDEAMERAWERRDEWQAIGQKAQEHIKLLVPEKPGKELLNYILAD